MSKVLTAVLIGAGNRGETYTKLMKDMPEQYKVVAVADPIESRRNHIKKICTISDELCFEGWEELFSKGNEISDIETSVNNHLLVFAAEKSRKEGTVIDFDKYKKQICNN